MNSVEEILEEAIDGDIQQDTRKTINNIKNMMDKSLGKITFICETVAEGKDKINILIKMMPQPAVDHLSINFIIEPPYDKIFKKAGITPI